MTIIFCFCMAILGLLAYVLACAVNDSGGNEYWCIFLLAVAGTLLGYCIVALATYIIKIIQVAV